MAEYTPSELKTEPVTAVEMAQAAIIVIDETGDPETSPLKDVLLNPTLKTAELLKAARKAGVPVIFANDAHIPGIDPELVLWGDHGIAGSPDAATSPQLGETQDDLHIDKPRYSAFFQTQLRILLQELGARSVVLCGFDTNVCIVHTAADAFMNGFSVIVPADATATFLIGTQEGGLQYMRRCHNAKVSIVDELISAIEMMTR